jgi:putative transposase
MRRDGRLKPAERDRVEMVLLSATGWTVPRIAEHLGYCAQTVRRVFAQFAQTGPTGLRHQRPGPDPDRVRRAQVESALTELLEENRTWSSRQLAQALRACGLELSARQVRRYLHGLRARYGRTARTLDHKQDPARVAAARADLETLKNGLRPAS